MTTPTIFEICRPREDVLSGAVADANFAADRAAVVAGHGNSAYGDPARVVADIYSTRGLGNRSLTTPQIRFIEMVIDQLTARGVMESSALYEAPFSSVHAGGPEALFAGKSNVIDGIFEKLKALDPVPPADVG